MEYKDYYKALGVPRTATQGDIKKAYRKLAREHHPDIKPGDRAAERRFKELNEANTVLSDPDKRKRYDTLGANWESFAQPGGGAGGESFAAGGPFGGFGGGRNVRYEFRTSGDGGDLGGFSDFFRMMFDGDRVAPAERRAGGGATTVDIDEVLAGMNMDTSRTASPRAGRSASGRGGTTTEPPALEAIAEISLEEAFNGTTRIVQVDGARLEVTIPRGVDNGSRIRLSGRGGDGVDLVVVTRIKPHPTFTRRGADLEREVPITLKEALLGGSVPVGTLKGRVLLTIPAGTQNGRTFRLSGQGMPRLKASGAGDLLARTRVVLPTNLSDEAKEAAARFLELAPQPDPR